MNEVRDDFLHLLVFGVFHVSIGRGRIRKDFNFVPVRHCSKLRGALLCKHVANFVATAPKSRQTTPNCAAHTLSSIAQCLCGADGRVWLVQTSRVV